MPQLIRDLHTATVSADGDDQSQRGTQLLEIYALEIQMYNETRNFKKLKVRNFCPFVCGSSLDIPSITGNLQCHERSPLCDSSSTDHGRHQGVWWQDVDGRA